MYYLLGEKNSIIHNTHLNDEFKKKRVIKINLHENIEKKLVPCSKCKKIVCKLFHLSKEENPNQNEIRELARKVSFSSN